MKTIQGKIIMAGALVLALAINGLAQTNLQFTAATSTDEQAIRLTWASTNNEVYQIQFANALATNADGSTAWQILYDRYPSQGTNTFWLDTGNYNLAPAVMHPKNSALRFYRILDEGQDSLVSDEPTVSVTSPTSDTVATGELTITVVAASDQPVISGTKLYVDGQEMRPPDSTTNWTDGVTNYEADTYSINTCEWGNETHTLFATAECQSGFGDTVGAPPVMTGHGVSPFVPVLFSNLVTRISFSQPSFDPSSGQTQQVSAVFAANCNWTLNIVDVYSNVVQTASGSGTSMLYNWDGTSNGTNLPNGIYYYYINAQTNGESSDFASGGSSSGPPSSSFARSSAVGSDSSELWAVAPDSESVVPLALYPPGFDTNGFTIFAASPSQIQALRASSVSSRTSVAMDRGGSGFTPAASGGGSSASSQNVPVTPLRPPNNPIRGLVGIFGIAYDTYSANGTNDMNAPLLNNSSQPSTGHISMNNYTAGQQLPFGPLLPFKPVADSFVANMKYWGWNNTINEADNQLSISSLRGSGTPFNNVNLGVLMLHGAYGNGQNAIDYVANGCKQMYFPITFGGNIQWLRLSEMNLGGMGTNGLKWMVIYACNSLYHANWSSMQNKGVKPYNGNLHLLLGCDTSSYSGTSLFWNWSQYMNFGTATNRGSYNPLTIRAAWYQAAKDAFHGKSLSGSITFAVAGDSACMDDLLKTNNTPTGSWTYDSQQVYP